MNVWGRHGQRGMRFPRRVLGHFLDTRHGAAEGVLGLVAALLVVWMLWPDAGGPELDHRASWQESVDAAERRRATLEAQRSEKPRQSKRDAAGELASGDQALPDVERNGGISLSSVPDGRKIATPSELADRLDRFGRRPGALAANQSVQPSPRRPSDQNEPAIAAEVLLPAETAPDAERPAADRSIAAVQNALAGVIDGLRGEEAAPLETEQAEADQSTVDDEPPPLDVAILTGDAVNAELPSPEAVPLPEVDLSDLDVLVPSESEDAQTAALAPQDVPDETAIAPSEDGAVEPFVVEPAPSGPAVDVQERPLDDAPSWLKNAVAGSVAVERPIIAVVIDDLGLNRKSTALLNDLPSPLTLAFLPYAGRIDAQTDAAQAAGHELMLHLPMEPVGSDWPGPDALITGIDQAEFTARLEKNLDRFEGFVGINNHMGSKLTADSSRMEVVMRELRERDVLFLDSKTSARSVAGDVASRAGVPNTTRDIFLDHVIDLGAIKRQLALTERIALRSGSAVAIGHPHGATIEALREWLPSLEKRGFALAPISAVVARRACSSGVLIAPQTCGRYLQAHTPDQSAVVAKGG